MLSYKNSPNLADLLSRFLLVRRKTVELCQGINAEHFDRQTMTEVSPPKWHLGHTSWFFDEFILRKWQPNYHPFHPRFPFLFNSYYESRGQRLPRDQRGSLTWLSLETILNYRYWVEEQLVNLLSATEDPSVAARIETGIHHEQQHQELLLMDVKHILFHDGFAPAYRQAGKNSSGTQSLVGKKIPGGLYLIGDNGSGFAYDNERPEHRFYLESFEASSGAVTNGQFLQFIDAGGYQTFGLWLALGWEHVNRGGWSAPLYWRRTTEGWEEFTLHGWETLNLAKPVSHVSFFEADAFAKFCGQRLLREEEWEVVAQREASAGNFLEQEHFDAVETSDWCGNLWAWTSSPYVGYPGFRPFENELSEYNAKFMCNQMVLRGGSYATAESHFRKTYRNFYSPESRWQFSGIRLGKDL